MNVRTRDATMQNVANNRYGQISEVFFVMTDGVHVQQTLSGVRMATVARIDHMHMLLMSFGQMARDQIRRARLRMTNDEHIGVHRSEIVYRVEQRLTFASR